ncbi:MAG: hypothetical protein V1899_05310 [Planctomycetota bacterium]
MMSSVCSMTDEILIAYDDGELADDRAAEVATHLKVCAMCTQKLRQLRVAMGLLAEYLSDRVVAVPQASRLPSSVPQASRLPFAHEPPYLSKQAGETPAVRENSRYSARLPARRAWKLIAWPAVAAALVIFVAGGIVFLSGNLSGRTAKAAMAEVAEGLENLKDFTARFERTYTYVAPKSSGYTRAQATGLVRCQVQPEVKLACEENWKYFDQDNAEIPGFNEKYTWARTGTSSFDRRDWSDGHSFSGVFLKGWQDELLNPDIFLCSQDGEMLTPQTQRAAYELACMLSGIAKDEYGQWFGKEWKKKSYVSDKKSEVLTYEAQSGREIWTLIVEIPTDGGLIIRLDQTLMDSNDNSMGTTAMRYEIIGVNTGLANSIFENPDMQNL